MFFFIGGVQPKTIDLGEASIKCPSCGLYQAKLKRIDHYLSLFFLPILPVKKGKPFIMCERCGASSYQSGDESPGSGVIDQGIQCPYCGGLIERGFKFCPFCGRRL